MPYDMRIKDGDIDLNDKILVSDDAQRARIILNTWKGEWFLDDNAGVDYEMLFNNKINLSSLVKNQIREKLKNIGEVDFTKFYIDKSRVLHISFSVYTKNGVFSDSITIDGGAL